MQHPLHKYDDSLSEPFMYKGEFYEGKAHGWGEGADANGNVFHLLCYKGLPVKVFMTWANGQINVITLINGETLCGHATDYYPDNTIHNLMFNDDGDEVGNGVVEKENVFYNKDGTLNTSGFYDDRMFEWWQSATRTDGSH